MFRALINPSSGVFQAVFYIQPFGSCGVAHLRVPVDWFVVVVSLQTSPQAHADEQYHMNQMVVYKKNSLRYP